ncbi:two-component sensor histidine kinase [Planomonospora parontospora subsp. parontospora]|uniref:Sensor-like histidine kinase SenX3 n=2 Tax=Planomonospora parontospora TaxID=58119 RepID=A0AA37F3Z9_9ACTN|nr:ATP-binding protein [Planomonospora parontospora]GGK61674.1 two-component sensor histidine kinase [Planomonospora parontospora]GII08633.1 two-component sensor histidine kinase [Planomonospora parontospora subsp. parontospora]
MIPEIVEIAAVTAGLGLPVALAGLGAMHLLRERSIGTMLAVLAAVPVVVTVAGVAAITMRMIIEGGSRDIVLSVVVIGGLAGLGVAAVLGRRVVAASRRLVAAVHDVPDSGEFTPPRGLPAELGTIAAALDEAYRRIRLGRERERALEGARRELVAWVSHDLRTPLAGMRAMAEALEDGVVSDPETVNRYHARIRLEADRLSGMVDDLFELSRIHAGALRLSRRRIGLGDLVADALAGVEPLARAKGVRLAGSVDPVVPVQADAGELSRALCNLVANAIRHTPAGGTVSVRATVEGGLARLSVTDRCGGIPAEDLPRVFDVAFRGEAARSPRGDGAGAGLGLAIARGIVEAHEGAIGVVNTGPGCRFEIRLPLSK